MSIRSAALTHLGSFPRPRRTGTSGLSDRARNPDGRPLCRCRRRAARPVPRRRPSPDPASHQPSVVHRQAGPAARGQDAPVRRAVVHSRRDRTRESAPITACQRRWAATTGLRSTAAKAIGSSDTITSRSEKPQNGQEGAPPSSTVFDAMPRSVLNRLFPPQARPGPVPRTHGPRRAWRRWTSATDIPKLGALRTSLAPSLVFSDLCPMS